MYVCTHIHSLTLRLLWYINGTDMQALILSLSLLHFVVPLPCHNVCMCVSVCLCRVTTCVVHAIYTHDSWRRWEMLSMWCGAQGGPNGGWGMHVHVCDFCRFVCVHIDIAKSPGAQHWLAGGPREAAKVKAKSSCEQRQWQRQRSAARRATVATTTATIAQQQVHTTIKKHIFVHNSNNNNSNRGTQNEHTHTHTYKTTKERAARCRRRTPETAAATATPTTDKQHLYSCTRQ